MPNSAASDARVAGGLVLGGRSTLDTVSVQYRCGHQWVWPPPPPAIQLRRGAHQRGSPGSGKRFPGLFLSRRSSFRVQTISHPTPGRTTVRPGAELDGKDVAMADVKYDGASRIYPGSPPVRAVDTLNLDIPDGEFLVLVGPSGSGKSTALRMLAGLEDINEGRIIIGGRDVTNVPPKNRDIAMVFQSYALYPHMTVAENMGFALKLRGVNKTEIASKVREAAGLLDLEKYLDRKPKALSGGQRQRVAMGRAIVREPSVFLMDEPLSNLDAKLRVETRANIAELQARLGTTTVYVTHDQVEAMTMGHRVAVLQAGGFLQQVDTPRALYDRPANVMVAGFIGSPSMNLVKVQVTQTGVKFGGEDVPLK